MTPTLRETCRACNGDGFADELDTARITATTISPPYRRVFCDECEGKGYHDTPCGVCGEPATRLDPDNEPRCDDCPDGWED